MQHKEATRELLGRGTGLFDFKHHVNHVFSQREVVRDSPERISVAITGRVALWIAIRTVGLVRFSTFKQLSGSFSSRIAWSRRTGPQLSMLTASSPSLGFSFFPGRCRGACASWCICGCLSGVKRYFDMQASLKNSECWLRLTFAKI